MTLTARENRPKSRYIYIYKFFLYGFDPKIGLRLTSTLLHYPLFFSFLYHVFGPLLTVGCILVFLYDSFPYTLPSIIRFNYRAIPSFHRTSP